MLRGAASLRCLRRTRLGGQEEAAAGIRWFTASREASASLAAVDDSGTSHFTDLTAPASWYPTARALQRRIVCHLGPTNSGKTHSALEHLKQSGTGVYCGPLRLLAWEVAERLNGGGVLCNLVTGQERKEVPGAQHVACTVEMASVSRVVDVAVVDEIQMMGDRSRGWSFTRALLGIPARTLHVCGDPAALPLLQQLCQEAGDKLEVRWYERLSPLRASKRALGSLARVGRGDCVVAFSRREVHAIRREVEAQGKKCCVVYGALPHEARSQQAVLFNKPRSGYGVLAASDAVGMGLNLNIRRVVFTSLEKFDGLRSRPLTASEAKQIAGRAGRFGSRFPEGVVTTLNSEDLPALHDVLQQPSDVLEAACIFPRYEQLSLFASRHPKVALAGILDLFAGEAVLGNQYFFAHFEDMRTVAVMLKHLPLSLRETYLFSLSPCDPEDTAVATALLTFATVYSRRRLVTPALIAHPPLSLASGEVELQQLEATHRVYDLFCWLALRFPDQVRGLEEAARARAACAALIDKSIHEMGASSRVGARRQGDGGGGSRGGGAEGLQLVSPGAVAAGGQQLGWEWEAAHAASQQGWWGAERGRGLLGGSGSQSEGEEQWQRAQEWQLRKRAYAKER